jgi:hypothetical protein
MLLEASPTTVIFKINVLPSHHAALFTNLQHIAERATLPHALVARAGGTIYFALLPASASEDATACLSQSIAQILDLVFAAGGHPSLLFAPRALKEGTNSRSKQLVAPASSQLTANSRAELVPGVAQMYRLKSAFDPQNVFAPGRFAGGI